MTLLEQGVFLFDFAAEQWIRPLISSLTALGSVKEDHDRFWEYYKGFMDATKSVEENLLPQVEKALQLEKCV